ncbi:MAG: FecR family protein [Synergistaceae bacterium]|jgi:hypothetical protein|nr:FecR family protein [Synergistaceae bacterium]
MSSKIVARRGILFLALAALLFAHRGVSVAEGAPVGFIKELDRTVMVTRGGREIELVQGSEINAFDIIKTGLMGYAMIQLIDGTIIELALNSEAHIVDVAFSPDAARLNIGINRGDIRLRTGSIGLKNKSGISITTPRSVITASNCELIFSIGREAEAVNIVWMPKGPEVNVLNVNTGSLLKVKRSQVAILTDIDNNMTVSDIIEEGAAEETR